MSEPWGPRGHPERCGDDTGGEQDPRPPRRSIEESLGTMFGILMLALILGGAVLWWVR